MSRQRPCTQVTLRAMPGAETWYRVEHSLGWFKLPWFANVEDLYAGAREGWSSVAPRRLSGETVIRVPLSMYLERIAAREGRA